MDSAKTILKTLQRVEIFLCIVAFAVMASVLMLDIIFRTFLGNGLAWSHQVGVYANIVVSLLGLGLASANGSHLRPRFADNWLSRSWEPVIQRLQQLVTALFFLFFAALAGQLIIESYQLQERSTVLQTLVWPVQLLLPLAFGLGAIRHGLYALYSELQPTPSELAE
jgi:TRAP-type C4-dicarboxylate transport system permease small subunit